MDVGEAIKILKNKGYNEVNQVGSHKKFKKDNSTITLVYHSSPKERVHKKTEKQLKKLLNISEKNK